MRLLVIGYTTLDPVCPSGDRAVVQHRLISIPETALVGELLDELKRISGASDVRIQGVVELNDAQSIANTTRTLDEVCMDYVSQVMQENRGKPRGSIAAKLGIGERTLYRYIKQKERITKCATTSKQQ